MANCEGCGGDPFALLPSKKATGDVHLLWLCDGCNPKSSMEPRKPRGLNYYRRFVYQIMLPLMLAVFALVELGIHI